LRSIADTYPRQEQACGSVPQMPKPRDTRQIGPGGRGSHIQQRTSSGALGGESLPAPRARSGATTIPQRTVLAPISTPSVTTPYVHSAWSAPARKISTCPGRHHLVQVPSLVGLPQTVTTVGWPYVTSGHLARSPSPSRSPSRAASSFVPSRQLSVGQSYVPQSGVVAPRRPFPRARPQHQVSWMPHTEYDEYALEEEVPELITEAVPLKGTFSYSPSPRKENVSQNPRPLKKNISQNSLPLKREIVASDSLPVKLDSASHDLESAQQDWTLEAQVYAEQPWKKHEHHHHKQVHIEIEGDLQKELMDDLIMIGKTEEEAKELIEGELTHELEENILDQEEAASWIDAGEIPHDLAELDALVHQAH